MSQRTLYMSNSVILLSQERPEKPDVPWLTAGLWNICCDLEDMLPAAFKGLKSDIIATPVHCKAGRVEVSMRPLKSIRVHLSPGSSCGLVAYTCAMVYGTYSYLLTGRDSGLMTRITRLGSLRGIHWSKRFFN